MSIRVVYLDHTAATSGGELALLRLIQAAGPSVEATVILAEDGPLVEKLEAASIRVEVMELSHRTRDLRKDRVSARGIPGRTISDTLLYSVALSRRLKELRPDVVHTNSLKSGVYGALAGRMAHLPVVWHLRDRMEDDYLSRSAQRLIRASMRSCAQLVVCNSKSTQRSLGTDIRSMVIPSVVPSQAPKTDGPGEALRIGMVGRIAPWKGQDFFLRAFAEAFPTGNAQAVLIGGPQFGREEMLFAEELPWLADELGLGDRVVFRGHQDDVVAEMRSLDVLVHASLLPEPFGQVVAEGMALGLPVIAVGEGGPAELIQDGVNGLLYPISDTAGLVRAMRRLRDDPALAARLGDEARRSAVACSAESVVPQLLTAYRTALG